MAYAASGPRTCAMVRYTMPRTLFDAYDPGETTFAISLSTLKGVLSVASDKVSIEIGDRVVFRTGNITRKVAIIEYDGQTPRMPDLKMDDVAVIDTKAVLKALRTMDGAEAVTIRTDASGTTIVADGNVDSVEVLFEGCRLTEEIQASYPMSYFLDAMKHLPDSVVIRYSTDYPMVIAANDMGATVEYLLAPRIEEKE